MIRIWNPENFKIDYLGDSWMRTSLMSCWCFSTFLVFMILTMAALQKNKKNIKSQIVSQDRTGNWCCGSGSPAFYFDADPDPTYHFDLDPPKWGEYAKLAWLFSFMRIRIRALHLDADPDTVGTQSVTFRLVSELFTFHFSARLTRNLSQKLQILSLIL